MECGDLLSAVRMCLMPSPTIDLARYTEPMSIWVALMTGHVRLVKMSWLIKHAKAKGILSRRQELPEEAFISVEELKRMYGDGNKDGVLPIIAISFCWDTAAHPDPQGKQLATVAATLEREQKKYAEAQDSFKGFSDMGVFWDWLSIYQKDPKLFDKTQTPEAMSEADRPAFLEDLKAKRKFYGGKVYENSRTSEEYDGFRYALHETMDLWYAHQGTTVYMLTKLPEGSSRKAMYADSGWTTYERHSAEQIKKFYLYHAQWKLVLDLGSEDAVKARNWPIGPGDFDTLIETKTFTNGADKDAVKALFRKMSINQLGGIKVLDFDGMPAITTEDGRHLGGCLNLCRNLESLDVSNVQMSDEACQEMFAVLSSGALPQLKELYLRGNQIGDVGMQALAGAVSKGALDKLTVLHLGSNQITDDGFATLMPLLKKGGKLSNLTEFSIGSGVTDKGMKEFADILSSGALDHLTFLNLQNNQIADAGLTAFAKAVESGALAALERLELEFNAIGDAGMSALAKAITPGPNGKGALDHLTELSLTGNKIGYAGMISLADALGKGALAPGAEVYLMENSATETGKQAMRDAAKARGLSVGALPQLKELNLRYNQIGDVGMQALAGAVSKGALDHLTELSLTGNKIGDTGMISLADALGKGALDNLNVLRLNGNQISDAGLSALAKAITPGPSGKGALDKLTVLKLNNNKIADAGLTALAKAVESGALASLETLGVNNDDHPALVAACEARGIVL